MEKTGTESQGLFTEDAETDTEIRNHAWEENHVIIIRATHFLIRKTKRWPSKAAVAEKAGLSRNTVYRHMEYFSKEEMMAEELEALKFMQSDVMAVAFDCAIDGDIRAMKLIFEVTGALKKGKAVKEEKKQ
jgi:hypothetical protein